LTSALVSRDPGPDLRPALAEVKERFTNLVGRQINRTATVFGKGQRRTPVGPSDRLTRLVFAREPGSLIETYLLFWTP